MKYLRPLSEYAWRFIVVVIAILAIVYALMRLKVVVLPLGIALLFASFLVPPVNWLTRHGYRRWMAAATVFLGFLATLTAIVFLIAPPVGDQFGELSETVEEGIEDIEEWLVEGPLELSVDQVDEYREALVDYMRRAARSSSDQIIAGAVIVAEVLTGSLLALLALFFILKDGPRMQRWALDHLPRQHRDLVSVCAANAWAALGGFLRGAALIGLLEGIVMAVALTIVGAGLALPVGVLTFFAAFFPVLGAIVAGVIATLVALVSGGPGDALVIAIVALLVQQFDNDLLAPVIYGRALRLHPLLVVSALTAGGSLFGIVGAFLGVPVTAVVVAVVGELWRRETETGAALTLERERAKAVEGGTQHT